MLHGELRKLGPLASLACGVITIAAICIVFTIQQRATADSGQTLSWSKCSGTVSSTYQERNNSTYVRYEYQVNGKKYIGQRIYFDQLASCAYVPSSSYHVGQTIPIFYDPKQPDEAVLRIGAEEHKLGWGPYIMGLLLGAGLILTGLRKLSTPRLIKSINQSARF